MSIMARACRSASNRATTALVSIPSLMIFSASLRRTGSFCSESQTAPSRLRPISPGACIGRRSGLRLRPAGARCNCLSGNAQCEENIDVHGPSGPSAKCGQFVYSVCCSCEWNRPWVASSHTKVFSDD
jgi:hypothetical protein